MKIFLHIGDACTGTTTLQNLLIKNRDVLLKHKGNYPAVGTCSPIFWKMS